MAISQAHSVARRSTSAGQATISTHYLGPHPIIEHYLQRLNASSILDACLPQGRRGTFSHGRAISILIHNILTSAGPLYRISGWAASIEASALGIDETEKQAINDDRLARALDAMASQKAKSIKYRLALRILKEWRLSTERVHFDTTTVTLTGKYKFSLNEPCIRRGYNKDHRPDLKQLVFGLNVTNDGAVPILHDVWSGNTTDDSVHKGNFDKLRHILGSSDFTYVGDSKLATVENMAHIAKHGGRFVSVLPRSRKETSTFLKRLREGRGVRWRTVLKRSATREREEKEDIYSCPVGEESMTTEGYRLVWYRSSEKARLDREKREASLKNTERELDDLSLRFSNPRQSLTKRGTVKKAIQAILTRFGTKGLFTTRIKQREHHALKRLRPGRPKKGDPYRVETTHSWEIVFERAEEALAAERRTDGVFPLVSHGLDRLSRRALLEVYKFQAFLEHRFHQIKTDYNIAPVYLKYPHRVAALLDVYFIAIAVASLIERDLRRAMERYGIKDLPLYPENRSTAAPTAPRILEAFDSTGWKEFKRGNEHICFPMELNDLQRDLIRMLDLPQDCYC